MESFIKKIENFSNRLQQYSLSVEGRKNIILFFQCWMRLYLDIYYLRALECYRHKTSISNDDNKMNCDVKEKNIYDVDMNPFKRDVWDEAILRFNRPEVTSHLDFVNPEDIPCPVEEYDLFKGKIGQIIQRVLDERLVKKDKIVQDFEDTLTEYPILEKPYLQSCEPEFIFEKFMKESPGHIALRHYPKTYTVIDVKDEDKVYKVYSPQLFSWDTKIGMPNFYMQEGTCTYEQLDRLILSLLLYFPVGKLKVSFIDLGFSSQLRKQRNIIPSALKKDFVLTNEDLKKWIDDRQQQLKESFERYGDLIEYNISHNSIEGCYEVCILNGLAQCDNTSSDRLGKLVKNGCHAGIYFVVIGDLPSKWDWSGFYQLEVDVEDEFTLSTPVTLYNSVKREKLYELLDARIKDNENLINKEQAYEQEHRLKELFSHPYNNSANDFAVEIGVDITDGHTISFKLDEQIHVHAFILGKTGAGKSVFLNTLLNRAMLKYSPKSLQFYLLDLKMGGVELDRYKSYPHVRALLVDESDPNITLEILRDLHNKMRERGELMRQAGCQNLNDYNNENPNKQMPCIILLVDECHILFKVKEHKIQNEISLIIEKIAKEGRSQGVHLIFATQTLAGCTIPREVKSQITDPYILYCEPVDAQYFIENPTKVLNRLPSYGAYHKDRTTEREEIFIPNKLEKEQMKNCLNAILRKSTEIQLDFKTSYFTGAQKYKLSDTLKDFSYSNSRNAGASLGRSLEVQSKNIVVHFKKEVAQNMLIVGNNDKRQGLRILMVSIISLMHYHKVTNTPARFIFFVNDDLDEAPEIEKYVNKLSKYGVEILDSRSKRQKILSELYTRINDSDCGEETTFLFISNQDSYAELKQDTELSVTHSINELSPQQKEENNLFFGGLSFGNDKTSKIVTTSKAWEQILENGPEKGFFTILQVSKLDRLLFKESIYAKLVYKYFQHIAFLRTLAEVSPMFGLDDIHLNELSDEPDRLRLCYLNATNNKYTILSPYMIPTLSEIDQLLK